MASSDDSVIDESLVGQWKELSESAGISADMTVLKFNHNEYYARYGDGKSIIHCRAYIVIVDGQAFINAQNIKDSDDNQRTFVFFRYSLADDGFLTLRMVSDDFIKTEFKKDEGLLEFIQKNMANERLYDEPIRFRKSEG